jgi:hypothetical protein
MIKAYHRVSSNTAYETILGIGAILPAAWRMHADQALYMCEEELENSEQQPESRRGVDRLLHEQIREISELQKREGLNLLKTQSTMLSCLDLIAGDFMNVFLSPGGFTNATIARGWPLSGFAFDAEDLIRRGAEYRPRDFLSQYRGAVSGTLRSGLDEDRAYAAARASLDIAKAGTLTGDEALKALAIFEGPEHDPTGYKKYDWPSDAEVVWRGPLPIDLAVELWVGGKILETRVA